jgi:beta-lactamase regulating signal transducer with metallopeptidase domain
VDDLVRLGLLSGVLVVPLALLAAGVGRFARRPALAHGLWLLVLLKLVTPPFLAVPIPRPGDPPPAAPEPMPVAADPPPVEPPPPIPPIKAPVAEPEIATRPFGKADFPEPPRVSLPAGEALEVTIPRPISGAVPEPPSQAPAGESPAPPPQPDGSSWGSWESAVGAAWLGGALWWWGLAAVRAGRFRRSLRHAVPADPAVQGEARQLAARLGLSRCPGVWLFPASLPPLLWAVAGAPRLLLPAAVWPRLSDPQRQTLLTHELAHLRRGDHWVRRLELLVLGLYWWHPVAWWARHELQEAEEQCCDAWVVWALPGAAAAYATALIEIIAFLSSPRSAVPVGASGIGHTYRLKRRLTMILQGTNRRDLTWGAALVLLACGAALLPFRPTWAVAQEAPEVAEEEAPAPAAAPPAPAPERRPTMSPYYVPSLAPPVALVRAEDVEDAKDEVDLLKVQLESKKAELQETQALLQRARRQVTRHEQLAARGAAGEGELDALRTELAVEEARLRAKEAQVREAELRLKQAQRRLARLQAASPAKAGPGGGAVAVPPPPAGLPTPGVGIAPLPPGSVPPGDSAQPAAPRDTEKRLRQLEEKMDALLKEMEALKRELHPEKPAAPTRTAPPVEPGVTPPAAESR